MSARATHRRLLGLVPGARVLLGGAVAAGLVGAVLLVVQAAALAHVVAGAAFGGSGAGELRGAFVALGCALAGRALLSALTDWLGRRAAERAMGELRHRVAADVLAARPRRVEEARRGELATAAVHGVDALAEYYAKAIPQIALAAVLPLGLVGVVLWSDPLVGALLAITLPLVVVFMVLVGRASAERIDERRQALGVLGSHFLDIVRGLPTLRAHGRAEAQSATLAAVGERYRLESVAALRVAFLSSLVLELLAMVGTAMAAAVVGVQLAGGSLGFETGLFVLLLAPEVYVPLRLAGQRYHAAEDGAHAAGLLLDALEGAPAGGGAGRSAGPCPHEGHGPAVVEKAAPAGGGGLPVPDPAREPLRLRGVRVEGGAGRAPALDGLDLTLEPGRMTALVGASGAGKSTLLRLLARLAEPDAGTVACGELDLRALPSGRWWPRVAWLPQRPALLRGELRETLLLAHPDASEEEIALALGRACALEIVAELAAGARAGSAFADAVVPARATQSGRGHRGDESACDVASASAVIGGHGLSGAADACDVASASAVTGGRALSGAANACHVASVSAVIGGRALSGAADACDVALALAVRVGAGGRGLSGGQVQRLALAGALLADAPLLLLDEPTAHLDRDRAAAVAAGIRAAGTGRTVVVATHDRALMDACDRVVELGAGRLLDRPRIGAMA